MITSRNGAVVRSAGPSLRRLRLPAAIAAAAAIGVASPPLAHHAFSMFALEQNVTVAGTVQDYQFKMPHVWLYLVVSAKDERTEEWSFECHSPNLGARKGWNLGTLKPGDEVSVTMHPMRDGSKAGSVAYDRRPGRADRALGQGADL